MHVVTVTWLGVAHVVIDMQSYLNRAYCCCFTKWLVQVEWCILSQTHWVTRMVVTVTRGQSYLGGLEGIVTCEMYVEEEHSAFIHGARWTEDCRHPLVQVVAFRTSAATRTSYKNQYKTSSLYTTDLINWTKVTFGMYYSCTHMCDWGRFYMTRLQTVRGLLPVSTREKLER